MFNAGRGLRRLPVVVLSVALLAACGDDAVTRTAGPAKIARTGVEARNISVEVLGTLGGFGSVAYDVNVHGDVVGYSYPLGSNDVHPFVWRDGTMIDLGTLGGAYGAAYAINDQGQVVGESQTAAGVTHAFLWEDGVMTDLGTVPGAEGISSARDINNRGQIVGSSYSDGKSRMLMWKDGQVRVLSSSVAGGNAWAVNEAGNVSGSITLEGEFASRAAVWENGELSVLDEPGSQGFAINNRGQVVGRQNQTGGRRPRMVRWWRDQTVALGSFGGSYHYPFAMNDVGQVVGISEDANFQARAFLWQDGELISLPVLEGAYGTARGINNRGQIVGESIANGAIQATLWTVR